uniref:Putative ovule protein n=1 Tax=Solanum chacoense TaxID=4108 RepID=A0A0V0H948_SOLCH
MKDWTKGPLSHERKNCILLFLGLSPFYWNYYYLLVIKTGTRREGMGQRPKTKMGPSIGPGEQKKPYLGPIFLSLSIFTVITCLFVRINLKFEKIQIPGKRPFRLKKIN